jgi:hypothetical protein
MSYLHFPQRFKIDQCFVEDRTSEVYQVKSEIKKISALKTIGF